MHYIDDVSINIDHYFLKFKKLFKKINKNYNFVFLFL
jgi:hypothetical protein